MLDDSARIQEEDARYLRWHLKPGHPPIDPLYTKEDVSKVLRLFEPLDYGQWHELSSQFRLRFSDAGHILGSAICEMEIRDRGDFRRVVFTIVLIGYQAEHTLGRRIVERQPTIKIFDRLFPLLAHVETLNGLSAHADALDFKWWFEHLASQTGVGQAFIVHGEAKAARTLASILRDDCDEEPIIPQRGESFTV